jgi:type I restriction enzyme S subunit
MLRTTNVRNGYVDAENVRYVTEDTYKKWTRRLVPKRGDIILTREAPLGDVGKIRTDETVFLGQRLYHFRPDPKKLDADFLLYSLMGNDLQSQIKSFGSGSTVEHMRLEDIPSLEINVPPLPIQRRIAGILSAYDELIENSQRRIKILESMARALYREWFVHFRFPGHESVPRVPSTMGEIPQGWETGRLDDVMVLQRGFDLPKASRIEGSVPIIAATGVTGFHNEARAKAPGIVTGRSGTIGEVLYVQEDFWPLNTSLWVKEFPKSEPLYAFYLLSSLDLKQFNSGAAVPTLNRNDIHGTNVVVPPRSIQKRFQDVAGAMLAKSRTLDQQIQNLRRTRDLLLPRLLSGQIDLGNYQQ